jgi:hypothetical protein
MGSGETPLENQVLVRGRTIAAIDRVANLGDDHEETGVTQIMRAPPNADRNTVGDYDLQRATGLNATTTKTEHRHISSDSAARHDHGTHPPSDHAHPRTYLASSFKALMSRTEPSAHDHCPLSGL